MICSSRNPLKHLLFNALEHMEQIKCPILSYSYIYIFFIYY